MCGTQLNRRWFSFALTAKDTSDFVKETLLLNRCDSKFSALILYNSVYLRFQLRNILRGFNGVCDIPSTMSFEITNQLIKSKIAIFILPIPKEIEAVNNSSACLILECAKQDRVCTPALFLYLPFYAASIVSKDGKSVSAFLLFAL